MYSLVLVLAALGSISSHPTVPVTRIKPVKAFQQFSADLLTVNPHYYKESSNQNFVKASAITPYGVGHLLAVLNEQPFWRVPLKDNFEIPLRLSSSQITDAYIQLDKILQDKDRNTFSFSHIYTPENEIEVSANLKKLGTRIVAITEDWETNAPIIINTQTGIESFGHLFGDGELVPFEGAGNSSRAIFVDTLTYSDQWHAGAKLSSIGPQPFGRDSVQPEYIAYNGVIGLQDSERFLSVGFPLNEGSKLFVIAQPKFNINQVTGNDLKEVIENSPQGWGSTSQTTVEFPALNLSLYGTPMEALRKMGAQSTFCNKKPSHENILQQISQRTYVKVDASGVTTASATGVDLSKNPDFDFMEYVAVESARIASDADAYPNYKLQKMQRAKPESSFIKHAYPKALKEDADAADSSADVKFPDRIRLDQPFFWFVQDDQVGPLYFGSVLSFERPQDTLLPEQVSIFESLQSRLHWSCEYANEKLF